MASPNWLDDAKFEMNNGNFAKSFEIIDSAPQKEAKQYAVQIDSMKTIMNSIRYDFSLLRAEGIKQMEARFPNVAIGQIDKWIDLKWLEVKKIDGEEMWFKRTVNNLWLIEPSLPKADATADNEEMLGWIRQITKNPLDDNHCNNWVRNTIRFTLDVEADAVPAGEMVKAWIPVPIETVRQKNYTLISSSDKVTESKTSAHHTLFMQKKAEAGKPTHFEVVYSFDVAAHHFSPEYVLANVKPYDTTTEEYKHFTADDGKHICLSENMCNLAQTIVGNETNPVKQAEKIYTWICDNFLWASARDYSTIPNIPEYVLEYHHGDCGQVTLLYINLVRSLGIPARWESGWMLHPGAINYHDWAETYFEGVGWVPTDTSFGRRAVKEIRDFYRTSTDQYRMAANSDYCEEFEPKKKFFRNDAVDSQAGEVEWKNGSIPKYRINSSLEIVNSIILK